VTEYGLTKSAERDLASIADYTIERFGVNQARRYRNSLFRIFESLAEHPEMGRDCSHAKEGCRRHEHGSHVIYYKITHAGIVVLRLLHERQDPMSYL
jgi:toxin ParE1/3/4